MTFSSGFHHVPTAVVLPGINRQRQAAERIDDRQDPDPPANWSDMKSIAHTSFGAVASLRSSRSFADTFLFGDLL